MTSKKTSRSPPGESWNRLWERRFRELLAFRRRHGHSCVASPSKTHPALGLWVKRQRQYQRTGTLSRERFRRLHAIGFSWVAAAAVFRWDQRWMAFFTQLRKFRRRHGHCRVPFNDPAWCRLEHWVRIQRYFARKAQLRPERVRRLNSVGFIWDVPDLLAADRQRHWNERFEQLRAFRRRHGHCRVPYNDPALQPLDHWVRNQRYLARKGQITPERARRLNSISFIWDGPTRDRRSPAPVGPAL